jgi:hypothetical protein
MEIRSKLDTVLVNHFVVFVYHHYHHRHSLRKHPRITADATVLWDMASPQLVMPPKFWDNVLVCSSSTQCQILHRILDA